MKRILLFFVVLAVFLSSCSQTIEDCNEYKTQEAKNACLVNLAVEKKDISICSQGPQNCLSVVWREFPEEPVCANIESTQSRDQCYIYVAAVKKNVGICRSISERVQMDLCIQSASTMLQDISSCNEILNTSIKDKCLAIDYPNKTMETCNLISGSELKADCTIDVATRERDYSLCNTMADQFRDRCYRSTAAFHGDIEKCGLILSPEIKDFCISLSARKEEDLKLCKGFNNVLKEQCTSNIAGASGKISLCNAIESAKFRDYCIRDAARLLKDGSHCGSISNSTIKDECYRNVAVYTKNDDFCSSIFSEGARMACFNSVNK
mgnify:CR=1 FL=1